MICAPENLYQVSRTFLRRLNWPLCSSEAWQISFLCFVVQDLKPGAPYSPSVILSTWAIFSGSPLSVRFTHLRLSLKPSASTLLCFCTCKQTSPEDTETLSAHNLIFSFRLLSKCEKYVQHFTGTGGGPLVFVYDRDARI